jgi:hypothetical protein
MLDVLNAAADRYNTTPPLGLCALDDQEYEPPVAAYTGCTPDPLTAGADNAVEFLISSGYVSSTYHFDPWGNRFRWHMGDAADITGTAAHQFYSFGLNGTGETTDPAGAPGGDDIF